jgi:hypothetical protein
MKIKITYEHGIDNTEPAVAYAYIDGHPRAVGMSNTWENARDKALRKVKALVDIGNPPPTEHIEL